MLPEGWIHPAGPIYLLWIPFGLTMLMGAPFGLLGGAFVRRWTRAAGTWSWSRSGMGVEMVLGGAWWSLSAILPPWGFPLTLMRSLAGAVLVGVIYACCLTLARTVRFLWLPTPKRTQPN
jgi:hypothetical protein